MAFINCGTSVFAGFVVFSFVGFMAKESGLPIDEVVKQGPGLVFEIYPEAFTKMPAPQFWSLLFFIMLLTLGLDSMFTQVETISTAILDQFFSKNPNEHKHWVVIGICVSGFFLGLSMCAQGGILMFTLIDSKSASWNLVLFALLELVLVGWLYGAREFMSNIHEMGMLKADDSSSKFKKTAVLVLKWYWIVCWQFITPLLLTVILITQVWPLTQFLSFFFAF